MDKSQYTPMMQHYIDLKKKHPDTILMYRLGDFYEMFFEDAKIASRELDLVLTGRAAGIEKVPMCGIPHRASQTYISKLVHRGYKVAICEQLEEAKDAKGALVERDIVQIVTPGTLLEEENNKRALNYLAVLTTNSLKATLILCELSTGSLRYFQGDKSLSSMQSLINEYHIKELIAPRSLDRLWQKAFFQMENLSFSIQAPGKLSPEDESLLPFQDPLLLQGLEVLMGYLQQTTMQHPDHFSNLTPLFSSSSMVLDSQTRNHLELLHSASSSNKAKSLWEFMDLTHSALGSRLLREWLEAPLLDQDKIVQRQEAIQVLLDQFLLRAELSEHLNYIYDLERLATRISYRSASPRDVLQLASSLEHAKPILEQAKALKSYPEFAYVSNCQDLYEKIAEAIVPEPPLTIKDGNYIAPGFNEKLDEIRKLADESEEALKELEEKERIRTGIRTLKIGSNRVFGYYVEIRNTQLNLIHPNLGYQAKQTLANSTRFVFDELKTLEEKILSAKEEKIILEEQIFQEILGLIKEKLADLHRLSKALAQIDVLCALAELASERGYVRPTFSDGLLEIEEGKHPILEVQMSEFVSNNWKMDDNTRICLITGPNMGGKSTWLRQNALLVVMAQIGSFVPARKAILPIFDRIFTRIGASDDLLQGKSTFMMEMMEANNALRHATKNSLILFDEIGRGTATYDGMALAQSILEYIAEVLGSKALFSTHYHELTSMEQDFPTIHNVHVEVKERKKEIEFCYRMVDGKADKSYGIHVAKLAGLPPMVITRAGDLLGQYEANQPDQNFQSSLFVMDPKEVGRMHIIEHLQELDIDNLSAREALAILYDLKERSQSL